MPLAETIKEFVSYILKGVDLIDHTSIFLLRYYQSLRNFYTHFHDTFQLEPLQEVLVGTNHESIRIIGITRWLIVRKRNILVWSIRSTPLSMEQTSSFMVSARGISNTGISSKNRKTATCIYYIQGSSRDCFFKKSAFLVDIDIILPIDRSQGCMCKLDHHYSIYYIQAYLWLEIQGNSSEVDTYGANISDYTLDKMKLVTQLKQLGPNNLFLTRAMKVNLHWKYQATLALSKLATREHPQKRGLNLKWEEERDIIQKCFWFRAPNSIAFQLESL